ncbi:hypothetical protein PV325_003197 [Microctonus aethiopoides]|nr:hypothetical protein PV325_003197 [Microctonus aethiopoides]
MDQSALPSQGSQPSVTSVADFIWWPHRFDAIPGNPLLCDDVINGKSEGQLLRNLQHVKQEVQELSGRKKTANNAVNGCQDITTTTAGCADEDCVIDAAADDADKKNLFLFRTKSGPEPKLLNMMTVFKPYPYCIRYPELERKTTFSTSADTDRVRFPYLKRITAKSAIV